MPKTTKATLPKKAKPVRKLSKKELMENIYISFHYYGDILTANTLSRWGGCDIKQTIEILTTNPTKFFLIRKNEEHPELSWWSNKKGT